MKTMNRPSESGVALITVLLVFAVISVLASQMFLQSHFNTQRHFNQTAMTQARYYTLGAEALARQILYQDWENRAVDNPVDHQLEDWAREQKVFAIDEGKMTLIISDLQARFNLNNLIDQTSQINMDAVGQLQRLLINLNLDSAAITAALQDWLDSDRTARANDTEDEGYLQRNPAYLAANRPLSSVTELLAVQGIGITEYTKLEPMVTVLPEYTAINLNTANAEVLQALGAQITTSQADVVIRQRNQAPITDLSGFLQTAQGTSFATVADALSINSNYFLMETTAVYQGRRSTLVSVLYRNPQNGAVAVISRNFNSGLRLLL